MSADETFVLLICIGLTLVLWIMWYWEIAFAARLSSRFADRLLLFVVPILCAGFLFFILKQFASHDVRDDATYLSFYMLMGSAWLGVTRSTWRFLGLSARDDVIERKNPAAAYAIGGALIATTFCFAGGNIGDGPGWWVVVFCAILATATLLFFWCILNLFTHAADTITIDRDVAAGIRIGSLLIGIGMILGRAVAGDWTSAADAVADFIRFGSPSAALLAFGIFLEKFFPPNSEDCMERRLLTGVIPGAVYVLIAIFVLLWKGWWK